MSLGNTKFHPSTIEDRIYDLMAKPENIYGSDLYTDNLLLDVVNMLHDEYPSIEWECFSTQWNNMEGGTMSFAWIEDGHLHLIGWDYKEVQ